MLDLFSGTGSAAQIFREKGFQVLTLDNNPKFHPDILCDIREWDYKVYPEGYFDFIAMSPPCTEYSTAMTYRPRQLEWADSLVEKAIEILEYFNPPQ